MVGGDIGRRTVGTPTPMMRVIAVVLQNSFRAKAPHPRNSFLQPPSRHAPCVPQNDFRLTGLDRGRGGSRAKLPRQAAFVLKPIYGKPLLR